MSIFTETKTKKYSDKQDDALTRYTNNERLYTVTIKPTATAYKSKHQLDHWAERYVNRIVGRVLMYSFEKMGTSRVHLHMLIQCPFIHNKALIAQSFKGFHIHAELVRKNRETESIHTWERYINKEASDSEFYHGKYGNMFTRGVESDDSVSDEELDTPNIIHYQ